MADSGGPSDSTCNVVRKCFSRKRTIDTVLWLSVFIVLSLSLVGIIPPRMSGFLCNDEYLMQKYTGDTISAGVLISSCVLIPIFIITMIESINYKVSPSGENIQRRKRMLGCSRYSGGIISDYLLGFLLTLTVTDIIKSMVGEKRPHFLDTCRPAVNCSDLHPSYVTDYKCTGHFPKWWLRIDIYKSFPSGHAVLSFFMATFMIMYLQQRVSLKMSHLLRPVIQVLFLFWAVSCSISRIIDNRHFWWDVLGGSILGIFAGYSTIMVFEQKFQPHDSASQETSIAATSSSMIIIRNNNADN